MMFEMHFCRGPFFDYNQTWNTTNPDLSPCMRDSVLVGLPSALLWISGPFWIVRHQSKLLRNSNYQGSSSYRLANSKLFWTKILLTLLLIANCLFEFGHRIEVFGRDGLLGSEFFLPTCLISTYILVIGLQVLEKRYCAITSPPLFYFWLLLTIGSIPTSKVLLEDLIQDPRRVALIFLLLTGTPLMLGQLVLNCKADLNVGQETVIKSPEDHASCFSKLFFIWMNPLVKRAFKETLSWDTLPNAAKEIGVKLSVAQLIKSWVSLAHKKGIVSFYGRDDSRKKKLKLWRVLAKTFGMDFVVFFVLLFLENNLVFLQPMVLKLLIKFMSDEEEQVWKGCLYVLLLFLVSIFNMLLFKHAFHNMNNVCLKMQSSVQSMIIRKSLRLSNRARSEFTSGEMINFIAVDSNKMPACFYQLGALVCMPYQIILGLCLLYMELGVAAFAGLGGILLMTPFTFFLGKLSKKYEKEQLKNKDERMKVMNEVLHGIKVLKLNAWEKTFMEKVRNIRSREIRTLKNLAVTFALNGLIGTLGPFLVTVSIFLTYVYIDPVNNILNADKIFVSLALFNLIQSPLNSFPSTIFQAINWFVSVNRISNFLNCEELRALEVSFEDQANSVQVCGGTFGWAEEQPFLKEINLEIPKGSFTAVVGVVGSGKSSLISALLGEMIQVGGDIKLYENVAYVPQEAWIQNMTLRDNILFSSEFQSKKYKNTLKACALMPDLKILPSGDKTEIGENGINLSGGQKQRVSLARAVYSDASLFLLDDPLSAVDSHVGKHIFEKVLSNESGILRGKTRILVTHGVSFFHRVDNIIVMKDGKIAEMGPHSQLKESAGAFAEFLEEHSCHDHDSVPKNDVDNTFNVDSEAPLDETSEDLLDAQSDGEESEPLLNQESRIVQDEQAMEGQVKWSVYVGYCHYLTYLAFAICLALFLSVNVVRSLGNFWLSKWADANAPAGNHTSTNHSHARYYLGIYCAIGLFTVGIQFLRSLFLMYTTANAAKKIHNQLLNRIMHCPMSFFDTNPSGRIINRFSSDIDCIDQTIPIQVYDLLSCLFRLLFALIIVSYSTPWFMITIIPVFICYALIQQYYVPTARQLRRLMSISRSPVLAKFSESIRGVTSIRAYRNQQRFISEMEDKIDIHIKCRQLTMASFRWLGVRNSLLGNTVVLFASIFALVERGSISPGLVGLSITSALTLIGSVGWMTRMICMFETSIVSLERVQEYLETVQEAEWELPDGEEAELCGGWPARGEIEFEGYDTRYREGTDLVLKGIDLKVEREEKLGICGRTGAGKSSLALALFRIIEPASGTIRIDGVDITKIGLQRLRSSLTIIPQDPVLFTGSLRFNVDPGHRYSDMEILTALEHANLKEFVQGLEEGLSFMVAEGGQNLSVGQRQLVCLGRALLKKTKVLVLDEATASVDLETDRFIQDTIRREFGDCTTLTVAHRLNTILDSTKIAVFEKGALVEHGSPRLLLEDDHSFFQSLAIDAGIKLS